jgi:hypothetical protein
MRPVGRFARPTRLENVGWHETSARILGRFEELSGASPMCSRFVRAGSSAVLWRNIIERGGSGLHHTSVPGRRFLIISSNKKRALIALHEESIRRPVVFRHPLDSVWQRR